MEIVVEPNPRGKFIEGYVEGALLPGTHVQIKAGSTNDPSGRMTWQAYDRTADGSRAMVAVLLEDHLQGRTEDTAYATGERCRVYIPVPGDELNVRVAAPGTATNNAISVGAELIINDGDGLLIATAGTPESKPWQATQAVADVTATGTLVRCIFTGY